MPTPTKTATATEHPQLRSLTESHCKARGCEGETEVNQAYCPACIEASCVAAEQMRARNPGRNPAEQAEYLRMIGGKAYGSYYARNGR